MGNYGLKKMGQNLLKRECLSKIRDCMNISGSSKIKFLIVYFNGLFGGKSYGKLWNFCFIIG